MRTSAAARRYAKALFGLAQESAGPAEALRELDTLCGVLDASPELRDVLYRPVRPARERHRVLERVAERLGLSTTVRHFCAVLVDRDRIRELPGIREELERRVDEAAGRVTAQVRSASALRDDQIERLRRTLSARTGREVQIEAQVDRSLIGGVVASVGGLVLDGSLRTQLDQLRATLMKGH